MNNLNFNNANNKVKINMIAINTMKINQKIKILMHNKHQQNKMKIINKMNAKNK